MSSGGSVLTQCHGKCAVVRINHNIPALRQGRAVIERVSTVHAERGRDRSAVRIRETRSGHVHGDRIQILARGGGWLVSSVHRGDGDLRRCGHNIFHPGTRGVLRFHGALVGDGVDAGRGGIHLGRVDNHAGGNVGSVRGIVIRGGIGDDLLRIGERLRIAVAREGGQVEVTRLRRLLREAADCAQLGAGIVSTVLRNRDVAGLNNLDQAHVRVGELRGERGISTPSFIAMGLPWASTKLGCWADIP